MTEIAADLQRRLEACERENRLLREQTRQAERLRDLWQNAVLQLKTTRRELIDSQVELQHSYQTQEKRLAELHRANAMIEQLAYSDQQILENMCEAVVVTNATGQIIEVNPAFEEMTGYGRDEVVGKNPRFLQSGRHSAEFYRHFWQEILQKGRWQGEIWNKRKSGEIYPAFLSVSAVFNWDGSPINYIGISMDLEELKRAQARQQEAETASRAKSAFLANMTHELRTPLNVLLGYAQVLQCDSQLSPKQIQAVTTIRKSGDYLLDLINDVLDLARIEADQLPLQVTRYDPAALLRQLASTFGPRAQQKGLRLHCETESLPAMIEGDSKRLQQALKNLLDNALKFTDTGEVRLRACSKEPLLLFEVSDSGIGIAAERLDTLFQPFQQASKSLYNAQGTGLGLAICQRLIARMGGKITVESAPGEGSRFRIALPLTPPA